MTYRIEVEHLDGSWNEAGKLAKFVDGAWVHARFATAAEAEAAIEETYADVIEGHIRVVNDDPNATYLVSPAEALNYLREEFPQAHMVSMRSKNGILMGYGFRVGASLRIEQLENGCIDMFGIRLFRDGLVYSRDKAAAKRALKALRAEVA